MASIRALEKNYFNRIPANDLELLLSLAIRRPKEFIFTHPEYCLSASETLRFFYLRFRYNQGYSIAMLRGHKEFCGLDFLVTKDTLIPRPDTELMVETVLEKIKTLPDNVLLIDVGTGTGCIPISIIKALEHKNLPTNRASIKTIGTDISGPALRVANKNAKNHTAAIDFLQGNLLEPIFSNISTKQYINETIIITANLPYLTNEQYQQEKSIWREPKGALVAAENGLAFYRALFEQITCRLLPRYKNKLSLYCEIDPSQSTAITTLIKKYLPLASTEIRKDLGGHDRLVCINLPTRD